MVRGRQRAEHPGLAGRVEPQRVPEHGVHERLVERDPQPYPVAEGRADPVRVLPEPVRRLAVEPAAPILPESPPACTEAVRAVAAADWLIFGPGSWYTSVIPHLLVPELAAAILASPARRLVTLNLAAEKETASLPVPDHLHALTRYLPGLTADVVLADGKAVGDPEPVHRAAESLGARLVLAPVAVDSGCPRHDPSALAVALSPVLGTAR
jgi:uncharacterized cofD-like protein